MFKLESNLPLISVDHIQIEQVIINLIRNANDAILSSPNENQGQISIQTRFYPNKEMEVRIKDNGPGIQEDQKAKIFMPFHTTKEEGMGMGLSISRSLIEAHNGKLYFNSQFGKGTTFYFTLPCIS
jgi:signal transduction histidine kinase